MMDDEIKGEGGRGEKKRDKTLQVQGHLYQNEPRASETSHKQSNMK